MTTIAPVAADPSQTGTAQKTLAGNFNTFLTLLTTQLQNQDPLNPMDSNQFTQQLVEFSQVEQQINTNDNLKTLIALGQGRQRFEVSEARVFPRRCREAARDHVAHERRAARAEAAHRLPEALLVHAFGFGDSAEGTRHVRVLIDPTHGRNVEDSADGCEPGGPRVTQSCLQYPIASSAPEPLS